MILDIHRARYLLHNLVLLRRLNWRRLLLLCLLLLMGFEFVAAGLESIDLRQQHVRNHPVVIGMFGRRHFEQPLPTNDYEWLLPVVVVAALL
jgi:uncharacterized membrane protein YphA (DoxX/SURF4 family)